MKKPVAISPEPRSFPDDELPEGWKFVTILDACEVNPPKPSKDFLPADAPVTFVPMPAVDADLGAITNPEIKPYLEVRNGFTSFRDGDVIMAKITPCMENGKAAIVHGMLNGIGFGSTEFHVMRSRGEILPEYLYHYIRQESFRNEAESHFTGSVGQKRVPADFIKQRIIPLPPLAEQQRIVARVEALLTHINAARDRLSRVPLIMKKFRQAVLAAACSGRLTEGWREEHPNVEPADLLLKKINNQKGNEKNSKLHSDCSLLIGSEKIIDNEIPESWVLTNLGNLFNIQSGEAFKKSDYSQQGYKLFQIANVGFGKTVWDQQNFLPENFCKDYENLILKEEDICIALNRPILGNNLKVTKITNFDLPAILYQRVGCLRSKDLMITNYSFLFMLSAAFREIVRENLQGTDQPYLNFSLLSKLAIPLPPLAEQHEIARRVGMLFERADAIDREVVRAGRRCERMTQAVLARAFRGELVGR